MIFKLKNSEKLKEVTLDETEDGVWYLVGTAKKYAQPMLCTVKVDSYDDTYREFYPIEGETIYFYTGESPDDKKFWPIAFTTIEVEPY